VAPGEPLKIGLVGCGGMGGGHLDALLRFAATKREALAVTALCDVAQPRLDDAVKKASESQGFAVQGYRYHEDLMARPDLHGVLLATPEHWHVPMSIDALAAGLDVYVEKPLCIRHEDALHLRDVLRKTDRILQVGTQYMMYPHYHHAKALIAAGKIGHPTLSQTSYCRNSKAGEWLYDIDQRIVPGEALDWERWCGEHAGTAWDTNVYHRWRRYRTFSTGIVGDLLPHMMTPLLNALDVGWPVRVAAHGGHYIDKAMENHDQVFLTIEFEREHTMIVAGSTCNETGLEILVRGHEANLYLGDTTKCVLRPEKAFLEDVGEEIEAFEAMAEPQDELRADWLTCMRTRQPNRSPIELACQAMVIIDLATRSLWGGAAWGFDPATETAHPLA
jgi:predicted dehydrogenase